MSKEKQHRIEVAAVITAKVVSVGGILYAVIAKSEQVDRNTAMSNSTLMPL